jgi:hypothetical protein
MSSSLEASCCRRVALEPPGPTAEGADEVDVGVLRWLRAIVLMCQTGVLDCSLRMA